MVPIEGVPRAVPRRRPWRAALAATVVATLTGAGLIAVTTSAQAATVDTSAYYVLVNRNSGKALDVYNYSTADGGRITQWDRHNQNEQLSIPVGEVFQRDGWFCW